MSRARRKRDLRIGVLVEPRYLSQRQPAGLCAELRRRGHEVRMIDPDDLPEVGSDGWLDGLNVVVPRGRSIGLLSLLAWAEHRGVPVVNSRRAIGAVRNKLDVAVALAAAAAPTPRTFAGPPARLAETVPEAVYPLVLKPVFGDNGGRLRIVDDARRLAKLEWPEPVAIAQQLVRDDGMDLKLYGIGRDVWAIRKPSPLTPPAAGARQPGQVALTVALAALARRCGELFGLDLYGVDCVETPEGPVVIEVNEYPNYTAVPGADQRLATLVERRAAR
jgi:ribosomal protein S6--L-glutamate ligase